MSWKAVDALAVEDVESAQRWWETLVRYLQLQERATKRRRWPDENEWAHGAAAEHQLKAQAAAAVLGTDFAADLREGRITVDIRRVSSTGPGIRVFRSGRWIYSVWQKDARVVNQRRPCLCPAGGSRKPITLHSCKGHAKAAAALAIELVRWEQAERLFWKSFKGQECCHTMDGCPLAKGLGNRLPGGNLDPAYLKSVAM